MEYTCTECGKQVKKTEQAFKLNPYYLCRTCLMKKKYGVSNISQRKDIKEKISNGLSKNHWDEGFDHHSNGRCYTYNDMSFDSTWQFAYWIWNRDNGFNIKRCSKQFSYTTAEGIKKFYHPQFEINDGEMIIDIRNKKTLKEKDWVDYKLNICKENNIKIISNKEIYSYLQYVSDHYDDNFMNRYRNKQIKKIKKPIKKTKTHWWNNGFIQIMSNKCPQGFTQGRIKLL